MLTCSAFNLALPLQIKSIPGRLTIETIYVLKSQQRQILTPSVPTPSKYLMYRKTFHCNA